MYKVNYTVDENNVIQTWTKIPFDPSKPYLSVKNDVIIHEGFDKVIDGKFVADEEGYAAWREKQARRVYLLGEIARLKDYLKDTDYLSIKFMEGELDWEEWGPIKSARKEAREKINEYENELEELN